MNKAKKLILNPRTAAAAIASVAIAGCAGNAASPPGAVTVVHPITSTLQLAVGSVNLGYDTGMNVVTTLRTPQGKSVLLSTPSLTGPFTFTGLDGVAFTAGTPDGSNATIVTGPSASELAAGSLISSTPQGGSAATTFGTAGGVFAAGFMPSNSDNLGDVGLSPYVEPNYNGCNALPPANSDCGASNTINPDAFAPIGGPPAYDPGGDGEGTRDGTFNSSVLGVAEGINVFEGVTPGAGTYKESVLIPTDGTSQPTLTATTTIGVPPAIADAATPTFVPDGLGGGTFTVTLPAGATEGLLNISDIGPDFIADGTAGTAQPINCYTNGSYPAFFTIHVTGSGTYTLPDSDGVGSPTVHNPTLCTAAQNTAANGGTATDADSYTVQLIATDYPLYGFSPEFTLTTPNPVINGALPTDDISISPIGGSADVVAALGSSRHRMLRHRFMTSHYSHLKANVLDFNTR